MTNLYNRWKLEEKRRLAGLLEIYPLNAYHSIAKRMDGKSEEEVKLYIEKMRYSAMTYKSGSDLSRREAKAPLEEWLELCTGLVEQEPFDASTHLSKVMSVIAHLEEFPERGDIPPVDYSSIYRYLAQILQGDRLEDVDRLKPLECSILLDLIHSLMDVLSTTDTTVQRNVMRWKCELMEQRDQHGHPVPESLRKAAENDFREFVLDEEIKWNKKLLVNPKKEIPELSMEAEVPGTSSQELQVPETSSQEPQVPGSSSQEPQVPENSSQEPQVPETSSQEPQVPVTSTHEPQVPETSSQEPQVPGTSSAQSQTSQTQEDKHQELFTKDGIVNHYSYEVEPSVTDDIVRTNDPNKVSITTASGKLCTYQRSWRHKPGRKRKQEEEEIPVTDVVVVMPPKNMKIVNTQPRRKIPRKERLDGKYQSAGKITEIEDLALERHRKVNFLHSRVEATQESKEARMELVREKFIKQEEEKFDQLIKLYEGHKKKYDKIQPSTGKHGKKKPKLYTVNPFCVPVSLLDLDT